MMPYDPAADALLEALVADAAADEEVLAVVLLGSRALGAAHAESDYDVVFVVSDATLDRYERSGQTPDRGRNLGLRLDVHDLWHEAPRTLRREAIVDWELPAWAESRVLLDRTGEATALIDALRRLPEQQAGALVAGALDAYYNALYRSLKAWRRGDELGGRLQAAQSIDHLLAVLFALERRWRPYSDRLWYHLDTLSSQGWQTGELRGVILALLSTGDPRLQQQLGRRVTALLRERGHGAVEDDWNGDIAEVLAWDFE